MTAADGAGSASINTPGLTGLTKDVGEVIVAALACLPLMLIVPYPSDTDVRGWTLISLNSLAKNALRSSHAFSVVSF